MIHALCWAAIYVARALECVRLHWGSLIIETRLSRWTTTPLNGQRGVLLITRLGIVMLAPCAWMRPLAVWLVVQANRGLPPLPSGAGFLRRLYPYPRSFT